MTIVNIRRPIHLFFIEKGFPKNVVPKADSFPENLSFNMLEPFEMPHITEYIITANNRVSNKSTTPSENDLIPITLSLYTRPPMEKESENRIENIP